MATVYSPNYPEQRIYVAGESVKFRGGEAEVPDDLAEVLLLRDGFSASPDGAESPEDQDSEIEAEVQSRLADEVERVTAEAEAKIEAEVELRVAAALEAAAVDVETPGAAGAEAEPAKRKPGRPKKTETAE